MSEEYKEVDLIYPLSITKENGSIESINKLTFRPIKAKALRKMPKDAFQEDGLANPASILPFIAASAGISELLIDEIDFRDFTNVTEAVSIFLPKSQETGRR